jgi:hypothetical protein
MTVTLGNSFDARPAMRVSGDAGGVGIQLPQRFTDRQKPAHSDPSVGDSDFGDESELKDMMKDIANPNKTRNMDDMSSVSGSDVSADYGGDGDIYSTSSGSPVERRRSSYFTEEEQPSQGFLTIGDEKADILFRLEVLRRQGIEPRKFSARDDIREMRAELNRIKTHLELDRSLKFSRKAVVGLASALEFLNDKVDVLDLELDGWSDQMHQAVYTQKDYDSIFEELFFKYRGKVQTPPEVRLLLTFGASALTFHMSNVMAKKVAKTLEDGDSSGGGGSMMDSIMKMMTGGGGAGPQIQAKQPEPVAPPQNNFMQQAQQMHTPPMARKEMKPPTFTFPQFGTPPQFGVPANFTASHIVPEQTNLKPDLRDSMIHIRDDESERLSDIPSDLESPPPSDFGSPEMNTIKVEKTARKPRGRASKKAQPRIIEI